MAGVTSGRTPGPETMSRRSRNPRACSTSSGDLTAPIAAFPRQTTATARIGFSKCARSMNPLPRGTRSVRGRGSLLAHGRAGEVLRPELSVAADADRTPVAVDHVPVVAGAVIPALERVLGRAVARADVL